MVVSPGSRDYCCRDHPTSIPFEHNCLLLEMDDTVDEHQPGCPGTSTTNPSRLSSGSGHCLLYVAGPADAKAPGGMVTGHPAIRPQRTAQLSLFRENAASFPRMPDV
jgi:hypothetical protein